MFNHIKKNYKTKVLHMNYSDLNIERFRKMGMKIGERCHIYSFDLALEPQLVTIGDECTIAAGVLCITHDNAIIHYCPEKTDLFGRVVIGNNCFIGARALLMYGVTIGNNCIIGAGGL